MANDIANTATTSADLVISEQPTSMEVWSALGRGQKLFVEMGEVSQADVLRRSVESTTEEELWNEDGLESVTNHLGSNLVINSIVGARNSTKDNALGIFLIADVTDQSSGENFLLAVGSADPVIKLLKQKELGKLPCVVKFYEATQAQKKGQNAPINISLDADATRRLRGDTSF